MASAHDEKGRANGPPAESAVEPLFFAAFAMTPPQSGVIRTTVVGGIDAFADNDDYEVEKSARLGLDTDELWTYKNTTVS